MNLREIKPLPRVEIPTARGVYRPGIRANGNRTLAIFSPAQTVDAWRCHELDLTGRTGASIAQKHGMDVLFMDLLGYGESDPNPESRDESYRRREILEDFATIMHWVRASYDRVVLISFSIHTPVWAYVAAANPDIVAAIVYLSPIQTSEPLPAAHRARYVRAVEATDNSPRGRTATIESLAKRIGESELGRQDLLHPDFWTAFKRQSMEISSFRNNGTWHGVSQLFGELCNERLQGRHIDAYEKHTCPTLIFRGGHEPDTSPSMTEAIFNSIPSRAKQRVIIPEASHFYIWEYMQDLYLDAFDSFFADMPDGQDARI